MLTRYENKFGGGETFVIVASGPSLTKEQVDYCRGKAKVMVINDNYKIAPWADYLYGCDAHWWDWHKEDVKDFHGVRFTLNEAWDNYRDLINLLKINVVQSMAGDGLTKSNVIFQGANSGHQAINLAYLLGARKIILIGYDMQESPEGVGHWFGEHPDGVRSPYNEWIPGYNKLANDCRERGVDVVNCTISTALKCFRMDTLENALR